MEKRTVSRLFGSATGYVGYEEGGQLTEKVRRKPFSVVLFDEIEKAHGDIFNSLLQILEDGRLTDAQGRVIDFKNTVIIMTTNLGTKDISKGVSVGFGTAGESRGSYDRMKTKVQEELKQHFRPEFLNRVDDTIVFRRLSREEIRTIVDLMIAKVDQRLKDRDMGPALLPAARTPPSELGDDPWPRARPWDGRHCCRRGEGVMVGWRSAAQDRLRVDVPRARHGGPGVRGRPLAVGARGMGGVHSTRRPGSGPLARRWRRGGCRSGWW